MSLNHDRSYLSVDCGGTKTAFLLCDAGGRRLASCTLGPANYLVNGMEQVLWVLQQGISEVCRQADMKENEIAGAFIALAAFKDIPGDIVPITNQVRRAFPGLNLKLGNDTENALAGSLLGKSGIHIIAGTGSIGLGCDNARRYIRSGGWHHLFGGDEGSAYWIGCRLLQHFTRQADGREKKSELYSYMMDTYQFGCAENILEMVIDQWKGERDKIASLAKDVYELAEREDSCAIGIFDDAGKELAMIIRSIYEKGDFEKVVQISYSGGVFKAMNYLYDSMEEILAAIPHVLVKPKLSPVGGGILLACEAAGDAADEKMIENLKSLQG